MSAFYSWWKKNFLLAEFTLSTFLAFFFFGWVQFLGGSPVVDAILKGNRGAVYGAVAAIFGSLLGFVITSMSIILGLSMDARLTILRESRHYPTLWKVFTNCIRALSVSTVLVLSGLIFDRDSSPSHAILFLCVWTAIWACFGLARCVWVLEKIVSIVGSPPGGRTGNP